MHSAGHSSAMAATAASSATSRIAEASQSAASQARGAAVIAPAKFVGTHEQLATRVRDLVSAEGQRLRQKYPLLKQQNLLGALILATSLAGMAACAWGYHLGVLPAWACIPLVAIFASFTHELEHDLIHWMYFRNRPWAHHLMMALVWLARPSTVSPWLRRGMHFNHHKFSGMANDIEERAITNGESWGLRRLLMTGDNVQSVVLRLGRAPRDKRALLLTRAAVAYFPLGWLFWGAWYAFVAFHVTDGVAKLMGSPMQWSASITSAAATLDFLAVVLIVPNILRTFCLHFISSNMHYFGDIEPGNVVQQTQVLNAPWLLPLQLFCFNFGSTHAIHHFVVKEPFYIRQMTAPVAHRVMAEVGVRFNDLGTFKRANRWNSRA